MSRQPDVVVIDSGPLSRREWFAGLVGHFDVLRVMARNDFQVRYKRASFGVLWAVLLPLAQAGVLAVVFSQVIRVGRGEDFGAFVLSGVLAWAYFNLTLTTGATAIVDAADLTDKVWFPRALLPVVPGVANLVSLGISMVLLVILLPILGASLGPEIVVLVPACLLMAAFTISLTLVLSALHVYFRDVRFIVQAALLVWFYATPVIYPPTLLGDGALRTIVDFNPMTGVIALFRLATVGVDDWHRPVVVSVVVTVVLMVTAIETHRRRDRLFVDQL